MRRIVIAGGGYAGFSTAWKLEKHLAERTQHPRDAIDPVGIRR